MNALGLLVVLAFLAGAAIATQAGINSTLARGLGGPLVAALVSFVVGTVALLALALARHEAPPLREAAATLPWWAWTGGVLGACFVAFAAMAAPRLGAVLLVAAVVAGQLAAAVVLDHFGWLGFEQRGATLARLAGVAMLLGGVALVRFG